MEIGKFFHSNYVMGTENMEILKVVIADDEVRICQLIQALIDWDSLGMKAVGIAQKYAVILLMGIVAVMTVGTFTHPVNEFYT